jgi:hypothetical protein
VSYLVTPDRLLAGLDAIGESLSRNPQALALLALGSCGLEVARLDAYSDLDFFVIVEEAAKARFIADLSWLTTGSDRVFAHRNTPDGWKTLDGDGVFCEFAVFHPGELAQIPFAEGRVVWARDGFDLSILRPATVSSKVDLAWTCDEALTNILIGLKRYLRGEKLSAQRMISGYAADLVCQALAAGNQQDHFDPWRRIEQGHAEYAVELEHALGCNNPPLVAAALLEILAKRWQLSQALVEEIKKHLELCDVG